MDPKVQEYLANKYQLGMTDDEKEIMSGSDERANKLALGQGMMEAADTIAAGFANREKTKPLFANSDPYQSNAAVREYIMNKMRDRQTASDKDYERSKEEAREAKEQAKEAKSDAQFAERMGLERQKLIADRAKSSEKDTKARDMKEAAIADVNMGRDAIAINDKLFENMNKARGSLGPVVGRLKSLNPWDTEAKLLEAETLKAAQNIGRYMEGGKLADKDIERYRMMLPNITDTPEVAKGKAAAVREMVESKHGKSLESLGAQGYNTAGFEIPSVKYEYSDAPKSGTAVASDSKVKIMSPSGEIRVVDKAAAQKYIEKGGKVVP